MRDLPDGLLVPQPLRRFQHVPGDVDTIIRWVQQTASSRGLVIDTPQLDAFRAEISHVIYDYEETHVSGTSDRWNQSVSRPIAIAKQNESPYDLAENIRVARHRLVLVAQNHGFMTDPNGPRDRIRDVLFNRISAGLSVDIVAMHPNVITNDSALQADASAVWSNYMSAPHFQRHVKRCWETLFEWDQQFHRLGGIGHRQPRHRD